MHESSCDRLHKELMNLKKFKFTPDNKATGRNIIYTILGMEERLDVKLDEWSFTCHLHLCTQESLKEYNDLIVDGSGLPRLSIRVTSTQQSGVGDLGDTGPVQKSPREQGSQPPLSPSGP
jgi:hypothetical protein